MDCDVAGMLAVMGAFKEVSTPEDWDEAGVLADTEACEEVSMGRLTSISFDDFCVLITMLSVLSAADVDFLILPKFFTGCVIESSTPEDWDGAGVLADRKACEEISTDRLTSISFDDFIVLIIMSVLSVSDVDFLRKKAFLCSLIVFIMDKKVNLKITDLKTTCVGYFTLWKK